MLTGLADEGFDRRLTLLLDAGLPDPDLPKGAFDDVHVRRRSHGRLAAYEDAVALPADLERLRPSLYHALDLSLPGRSPCPVLATLHDLIPWSWAGGGSRMLGERLRWLPGRRLLKTAERVIAVSQATAADATRFAGVDPRRIEVVAEGVEPVFHRRPGAAGWVAERWAIRAPFFLYVGALDVRKDPGSLLRAWAWTRAHGAIAELVLAGDPGPQAPRLMPGARSLGHVSTDDLAQLLSAAACLIFPSRYEGFGLPLLEAMACGCPFVAFDNSSLVEVGAEAGRFVPDGDADELGKQALEVLQDAALATRLRSAGLERARLFSWRRAARRTISVYEALLR